MEGHVKNVFLENINFLLEIHLAFHAQPVNIHLFEGQIVKLHAKNALKAHPQQKVALKNPIVCVTVAQQDRTVNHARRVRPANIKFQLEIHLVLTALLENTRQVVEQKI